MKRTESWLIQSAGATALSSVACSEVRVEVFFLCLMTHPRFYGKKLEMDDHPLEISTISI